MPLEVSKNILRLVVVGFVYFLKQTDAKLAPGRSYTQSAGALGRSYPQLAAVTPNWPQLLPVARAGGPSRVTPLIASKESNRLTISEVLPIDFEVQSLRAFRLKINCGHLKINCGHIKSNCGHLKLNCGYLKERCLGSTLVLVGSTLCLLSRVPLDHTLKNESVPQQRPRKRVHCKGVQLVPTLPS